MSVQDWLRALVGWRWVGGWVGGAYETPKVIHGGLAKQGWQLRLSSIHGSHESEQ